MGCSAGTYNTVTNKCDTTTCSSGTYNASTGMCESCANGNTYDATNNQCVTTSCSSGTYNSTTGLCETCPNGGTYNSGTNSCSTRRAPPAPTTRAPTSARPAPRVLIISPRTSASICTSVGYTTYDAGPRPCAGTTLHTLNKNPTTQNPAATTPQTITATGGPTNRVNPTASATQSPAPSNKKVDWYAAVQNTCKTGYLWNYSTPSSPTSAGQRA